MSDFVSPSEAEQQMTMTLEELDRQLVLLTQEGLPLVKEPYKALAEQLNVDHELVKQRFQHMLTTGRIRRIAAVPNHYKLGFRHNGMSVWQVPEEKIKELGPKVGALNFVSHCYHRPKHPPYWNYNLFAMVHGKDRSETDEQVRQISELLGEDDLGHDVLFSTRILKKTGLRFSKKKAD